MTAPTADHDVPALLVRRTGFDPGAPTLRACHAARRFNLDLEARAFPLCMDRRVIALDAAPGAITLVAGPSGSGKTTLLADIARAAQERDLPVIRPPARFPSDRPCIDLVKGDVDDAMRTLASAGLAEARCFVARPSQLSEGQRWRLRLALCLRRIEHATRHGDPALAIIDEFGATLDPTTAFTSALLLRRFVAQTGAHAIVATPHEHLAEALGPVVRIHASTSGGLRIDRFDRSDFPDPLERFEVIEGARADLDALAPHHYRRSRPATVARTLSCIDRRTGEVVGVLCVSMPTLNASWRAVAWPGEYEGPDRAMIARRLNAEVRTISRVIVEPRFRGIGLATRLVRAYLDDPLTPRTEAPAAMGAFTGFFQRAGMRRIDLPPSPRTRDLLGELESAGIQRWRLATPRSAVRRAESEGAGERITRALRRWKSASRATRAKRAESPEDLMRLAARCVVSDPVVFVHDRASSAR